MAIDKDFRDCLKATSSSVSEAAWILDGYGTKYGTTHKWAYALANGRYADNIKLLESRLQTLGFRLQIVVDDGTIS